jgi:hypothetical protein
MRRPRKLAPMSEILRAGARNPDQGLAEFAK